MITEEIKYCWCGHIEAEHKTVISEIDGKAYYTCRGEWLDQGVNIGCYCSQGFKEDPKRTRILRKIK